MRILVLGVTGILGHCLFRKAQETVGLEAYGTARDPVKLQSLAFPCPDRVLILDAHDPRSLEETLALGFDRVINCIGITKALCDPKGVGEAVQINALFPHRLARLCDTTSAQLIQISTDCVFSGRKGNYAESDRPDPVDAYGRAKLRGEVGYGRHLTIRTSFIGFEPFSSRGLLAWFLSQRGAVKGYSRVYWNGLTAEALSDILLALCAGNTPVGILNLAGEVVSKWELLCLIRDVFGKNDIDVLPSDEPRLDRSLDPSRAMRLGIGVPPMRDMIHALAGKRMPARTDPLATLGSFQMASTP